MAALTDAAPPSRRQQIRLWDSDAWSCPDPERCVRCDCAVASPSTPAAGIVKFILDNQAASYEGDDHEDSPGEDGERWFMVGCRRPYQYEPLAQGGLDREEGDGEDELAVLLVEEKPTLVVADDEDERQQHQVKSATEIKKKKKKADSSNLDDSSSSSNSSSSSGSSSSSSSSSGSDSDDSSSSSNTSDSSDSSSSSNSSSSSSSTSSSGSSDSSTLSDSSASDSSGDDSQKNKKKKKKKRKPHPSNSNPKQRDSCSKGGNKNPVHENPHAPLVATAKDNGSPDDYDDDNDKPSKGIPPTTSVLSVVMKVPQTTSSHSTVEDGVSKAHRESGAEMERKNSRKQSKRQHHKRDR